MISTIIYLQQVHRSLKGWYYLEVYGISKDYRHRLHSNLPLVSNTDMVPRLLNYPVPYFKIDQIMKLWKITLLRLLNLPPRLV